ncbi:MAG TPA: hypothetical protein VFG78_04370 [Gemmatimonadota bacterium]|nr:hypothetical protein [Gemmatimonadota bacterium]
MEIDWEPRAEELLEKLLAQIDRRDRQDHAARSREAAEVHARTHGVRRVSRDAAVVGFAKASGTMMKTQVTNAMRRVGIDPRQYEEYL